MKAVIDAQVFKKVIKNTKKFTGSHDKKMSYIYLKIDADNKELTATALDGHTISVEYAKLIGCDSSFKCFIKPIIPKIDRHTEIVELELVDKKLFLTVGEMIMGYIQPDGEFYDTDTIIKGLLDRETKSIVGVSPKLLCKALECERDGYKDYAVIETGKPNDAVVIRSVNKNDKSIKVVLPVNIMAGSST